MKFTKLEQDYDQIWVYCHDKNESFRGSIFINGQGGGHITVDQLNHLGEDLYEIDVSCSLATQMLKHASIMVTSIEHAGWLEEDGDNLGYGHWKFKYQLQPIAEIKQCALGLVSEPCNRAYVVKLFHRQGESEIESCYLVTGDQNLTEAMVSSVGLNFVTNCNCLLPDSDAGDDVYSDGYSLFWINQITELEPSEIEVVSKYMLTQEYEVLLQGGKLPDAKH